MFYELLLMAVGISIGMWGIWTFYVTSYTRLYDIGKEFERKLKTFGDVTFEEFRELGVKKKRRIIEKLEYDADLILDYMDKYERAYPKWVGDRLDYDSNLFQFKR